MSLASPPIMNSNLDATVYLSVPMIQDLCCIMCEIDPVEAQDSSATSSFHWQIIKCRLLVHMVEEVIASPVLGTERYIFVISEKKYLESGGLHLALKSLRLILTNTRPVTPDVYKICLGHTIRCKIAPVWNQVGQYLLEGKQFYDWQQPGRAVKQEILVDGETTQLQLRAGKIKLRCLKLEDFYLAQSVVAEFLANPRGYIDLTKHTTANVHVLPSLKKGKVLSVSKEIPERCPFNDYDQLRRHWKNMYGYSLPKNKDGILYYEIKFPVRNSNIFTYPNMCIAVESPELQKSWEAKSMVVQFLTDLRKAVPRLCGKPLQTSDHKFLRTETPQNCIRFPSRLSFGTFVEPGLPGSSADTGYNSGIILNSGTEGRSKGGSSNQPLTGHLTRFFKIHDLPDTPIAIPPPNRNSTDSVLELNGQTVPKGSSEKPVIITQETVSAHFKIKKPKTITADREDRGTERKPQKRLSLKEKLGNAKENVGIVTTALRKVEEIDVESLARSNKLSQLKQADLSAWLKNRSIPHNTHGKKADLMEKILCHLRNTRRLHGNMEISKKV